MIIFKIVESVLNEASAQPFGIAFLLLLASFIFIYRNPKRWKWILLLCMEIGVTVAALVLISNALAVDDVGDWFVGVCSSLLFGLFFFLTMMVMLLRTPSPSKE